MAFLGSLASAILPSIIQGGSRFLGSFANSLGQGKNFKDSALSGLSSAFNPTVSGESPGANSSPEMPSGILNPNSISNKIQPILAGREKPSDIYNNMKPKERYNSDQNISEPCRCPRSRQRPYGTYMERLSRPSRPMYYSSPNPRVIEQDQIYQDEEPEPQTIPRTKKLVMNKYFKKKT
jgi:hypothetical protein